MWVFGYGSLMWDGWHVKRDCIRHMQAELAGYRRVFNKASIKNWGTKAKPCPTLNLEQCASGVCRGTAFEFLDNQAEHIRSYLAEREGRGFVLTALSVRLDDGNYVEAVVPLYNGKNLLPNETVKQTAHRVLDGACGVHGSCEDYVRGIASKLSEVGIVDPAVTELLEAITG